MPDPAALTAQQRRTRGAIVDAASRLLARGETPSMAEVAAEAEVARRAVYLYFSTVEQLLIDAVLGQITQTTIEAELSAVEGLEDVDERLARTVRAIQQSSLETEHLGRTLIRLSTPGQAAESGARPRGYRRVVWLKRPGARSNPDELRALGATPFRTDNHRRLGSGDHPAGHSRTWTTADGGHKRRGGPRSPAQRLGPGRLSRSTVGAWAAREVKQHPASTQCRRSARCKARQASVWRSSDPTPAITKDGPSCGHQRAPGA